MRACNEIGRFSRILCRVAAAFGLALSARAVNVEKDVVASATDLGVAGAYSPAVVPASTNDVVFRYDTTYANASSLTIFAASVTPGTLNDLNATALTISGPNSGTTARTLTLNGGGDTISGSQPADLIYLTNGASMIIQNGAAKNLGLSWLRGRMAANSMSTPQLC